MLDNRCSYCGDACQNPIRLNFAAGSRDHQPPLQTTLYLCSACSNSWCTDRAIRSPVREEWVGRLPGNQERRAG
jgi:hypothetical protein